jgi:hypothetical protein
MSDILNFRVASAAQRHVPESKPNPNRTVVQGAWETVKKLETVLVLADKVTKVATLLAPFL